MGAESSRAARRARGRPGQASPGSAALDNVGSHRTLTSGNLGKGWNELDLVPHRLTTDVGTQANATPDYNVVIAADHQTKGETGYDVVSVDWRIPLAEARRASPGVALQGNLDSTLLLGPRETLVARARRLLEAVGHEPGYIFNLGHGIQPSTPPENVKALVDAVHGYQKSLKGAVVVTQQKNDADVVLLEGIFR